MGLVLFVLIFAILLGLGGFAVNFLWYLAVAVFLLWLIGFFVRGVEGARWYRW